MTCYCTPSSFFVSGRWSAHTIHEQIQTITKKSSDCDSLGKSQTTQNHVSNTFSNAAVGRLVKKSASWGHFLLVSGIDSSSLQTHRGEPITLEQSVDRPPHALAHTDLVLECNGERTRPPTGESGDGVRQVQGVTCQSVRPHHARALCRPAIAIIDMKCRPHLIRSQFTHLQVRVSNSKEPLQQWAVPGGVLKSAYRGLDLESGRLWQR